MTPDIIALIGNFVAEGVTLVMNQIKEASASTVQLRADMHSAVDRFVDAVDAAVGAFAANDAASETKLDTPPVTTTTTPGT